LKTNHLATLDGTPVETGRLVITSDSVLALVSSVRLPFLIFIRITGCQMVYFHSKNPNLGNLESLEMENIGIFYGRLEHFTAVFGIFIAIWYFCGHLVYFSQLWYIVSRRKIWQP
jgi:hypothetical protein